MRKLDRTRSYGTVTGDAKRHFHQDNIYFDSEGNEVVEDGVKPKPKAEAKKVEEPDASTVDTPTGGSSDGQGGPSDPELDAAAPHESDSLATKKELQAYLKKHKVKFETDANLAALRELARKVKS